MSYELYMRRCCELAKKADHQIKTNPRVGAVIVHEGRIIGEGFHQKYGEAHAEIHALNSVKECDIHLLNQSTMYVSLEPCAHYGKTPPCCVAVADTKIPKVVIATKDPTSKVMGKGIAHLRDQGVELTIGVLEKEAKDIIKPFRILQQYHRPYITLKWAQSSDGYMGKTDQQIWISDPLCQIHSHKLRSTHDAILVGKNTVMLDNPILNNRLFHGHSPAIVILDSLRKIDIQKLKLSKAGIPIYIFNHKDNVIEDNIHYIDIDPRDLTPVLSKLRDLGIYRLLVEGGGQVLSSFIKAELWDKAYCYKSPNPINIGIKAPNLIGKLVSKTDVGSDKIFEIERS